MINTEKYEQISIESKMPELKKCSGCRCNMLLSYFDVNKNTGMLKKSCKKCLERAKMGRERNKCPHGRERKHCKECGGSSICEHNRIRSQCKDCNGSQICEHKRRRNQCRECMNREQKIEFIQKRMISNSREKDKKYNRYDADHFIDKPFLEGLFEDYENCHYCDIQFTYNELCDTFVTIERLNNSIGHIKSNCVLACWDCNHRHQSRDDSDEEKSE